MKSKLLFGIGIAAGYVLGSRSGRAAYDKLKARAAGIWDSKPVQDKVTAATEAIKEKAPRSGTSSPKLRAGQARCIGSAMHRDVASGYGSRHSPAGTSADNGHVPARRLTGTVSLETSEAETNPALNRT